MKKYFFLLFLFIIYLIIINTKTKEVNIETNDVLNKNVIEVTINFINGINSKKLGDTFENYNREVKFKKIETNNDVYDLSCNKISSCQKEILDTFEDEKNFLYLTNGLLIKKVNLVSYKEDLVKFLEYNKFDYKIN
ncbi:MAG: hypothetical protein RSB72_02955 [Bacilli bacterium]